MTYLDSGVLDWEADISVVCQNEECKAQHDDAPVLGRGDQYWYTCPTCKYESEYSQ